LKTSEIDFNLPRELISFGPTPFRGDSRLMVLRRATGEITHCDFNELELLLHGYEVWANDLKLLRGKIKLWRDTGHEVDCTLLRRAGSPIPDKPRWIAQIQASYTLLQEPREWRAEDGTRCRIVGKSPVLPGGSDEWEIEFERELDLDDIGKIILPTHIRPPETKEQESWYEPVYATSGAGIYAPTAGISITHRMSQRLDVKFLTLHLEYDHIRTIETETVEEHALTLRPERYEITDKIPSEILPLAAIGTTVMKTLETYARTLQMAGESDLFISPPFEFKRVKAFLTNFHLPRESLLALTCAFGGTGNVMRAYEMAVKEKYRFSDYGDSILIL
jgi:S-adenosylmethionine:tRNA ribosyltransferase-isomerase